MRWHFGQSLSGTGRERYNSDLTWLRGRASPYKIFLNQQLFPDEGSIASHKAEAPMLSLNNGPTYGFKAGMQTAARIACSITDWIRERA